MLRLPELHRQDLFRRISPGREGASGHSRLPFEDLLDDWLAPWIRAGPGANHQRHDQAAEPEHVQFRAHDPEGSSRRALRAAAMRRRYEGRIHPPARPDARAARQDSWYYVRRTPRRLLCLSKRFGVLWEERHPFGW